jgi:hypothetical protein
VNLRLYARALWRFKWLALIGFLLAVSLAVLSAARFELPAKLVYRQSEVWTSQSKILLTEPGFPWGRSIYPVEPAPAADELDKPYVPKYADPGRFYGLAELYSQFANSDRVRAIARSQGLGSAKFTAAPIPTSTGDGSLPLIGMTALAPSANRAVEAANLAGRAFRVFITEEQTAGRIPERQRVRLAVVSQAREASLVEGRKMTLPIVVFLSVIMAFLALVFVLDNLRPRRSAAEEDLPTERVLTQARRSA